MKIRAKISELLSTMLDNPDDNGIYKTTQFMDDIEKLIKSEVKNADPVKYPEDRTGVK